MFNKDFASLRFFCRSPSCGRKSAGIRDMTKRHLFRGAAPAQKMAGMLIEQIDTELVALYRRAAEMRGHLK